MEDHTRKIALVTGANKGLGFEISKQLAQKGSIPLMKASNYGRIVNMSSTLGSLAEMNNPNW